MIGPESANARATFYSLSPEREWQPVAERVPVLYEPQGTSFVNESSGDVVHREERIMAPLDVDQHADEGDRVDLHYRDRTRKWRITNFQARSIDGVEGYVQLEFADFGDSDIGNDGSGGWDIG